MLNRGVLAWAGSPAARDACSSARFGDVIARQPGQQRCRFHQPVRAEVDAVADLPGVPLAQLGVDGVAERDLEEVQELACGGRELDVPLVQANSVARVRTHRSQVRVQARLADRGLHRDVGGAQDRSAGGHCRNLGPEGRGRSLCYSSERGPHQRLLMGPFSCADNVSYVTLEKNALFCRSITRARGACRSPSADSSATDRGRPSGA
jgi:hypothetical protein